MSINTSIELAFSGLRATQAGLDVVSQNIANAGSTGYVRRVLNAGQQVAGGRTIGVQTSGAQRMLDTLVQRQLRLEQAGASYTATRSSATAALNQLFDKPGGSGSLATLVTTFTTSLQTLANNPTAYPNRTAVLAAASDLAQTLNGLSDQVLAMRQSAENAIGTATARADGLLQQIAVLDRKVVADPASAALKDQRDALVDQLSTLMDVKVSDRAGGGITLATSGGLQLFDGQTPTRLAFDRQSVGAGSAYSTDPAKRSVGTITATDGSGTRRDVIAGGLIRSGEIAAQIELRDTTLRQASAQLDQLAAGLAASLSDKAVAGTAASSGGQTGFAIDLASLQAGNSFAVTVTDAGGAARKVTFVKATSAAGAAAASAADPSVVGLDVSAGMSAVATAIAAKLNTGYATPGFSVSNSSGSVIQILDDGAAATTDVTALAGTGTVTSLAGGSPQLPLFVDGGRSNAVYSGSYDGGSQLAGFASRIAINPGAVADPSTLVAYGSGVQAGDTTRPLFILDALTNADRTFSGQAGIAGSSSPYVGTVVDFAQRIIETQAGAASSAATLDSGQKVVLANLQSRFSDQAGVNIDTEMTQLVQLQTAYGANARVLAAAKEMMDMLLRVGG